MRATWIVQSNKIKTSQVQPLIEALRKLGEPFIDVGIDLESGLITPIDPALGSNLIPYGSTKMVKVAQEHGWKHLFFNPATFRVDAWINNHPMMLNRDAIIMTLSDAVEAVGVIGRNPRWFIRPLHDLKEFPGHVISQCDLIDWVRRLAVGDCELSADAMIAISKPKDIQMEWRYFIVGRKIVTGSSYRFKGQPHLKRELDVDVLAEAQKLADIWLPHETCCMDVALCNDEARVVEFNGLNASGFYDHDIEAFAKAVSNYANSIKQ